MYRRCGLAGKVSRLVEVLVTSPSSAPLESDEQGVLDAAAALKQYVRQQEALFPERDRPDWLQAAGEQWWYLSVVLVPVCGSDGELLSQSFQMNVPDSPPTDSYYDDCLTTTERL